MPCYDSKYCAVGRSGHFLPVLGMRQRIGSGVTERKKMETVRFDELDLYPQVLRAIADMGFEEATPIQSQAIPVVMSGVDGSDRHRQVPVRRHPLVFRCFTR